MASPPSKRSSSGGEVTVATNRRARFDYEIADSVEAGMVLQGTEVKSLRNGGGVIGDAYALCKNGEVFVIGMKINPYAHGNIMNHAVDRTRKLLLNKREIAELESEARRGMQLVPMRVYFKNGRAKMELGVGKPRKAYDKRAAIKEREEREELRRNTGRHARGDD
jgi:SsrA-binding protein